jgi:hypothetical protein
MFQRWAVRGLIPSVVLGSLAVVSATGSTADAQTAPHAAAPVARIQAAVNLPDGVHQKRNGRFVKDMCDHHARHHCLGQWLLPETWQPGMDIPKSRQLAPDTAEPMAPNDVATAYKLPATSLANGKIVAILDAPDSNALTDLQGYRTHNAITQMNRCAGMPTGTGTPCFAQINEDGTPSSGTDPSPDDDGETALDLAMISAACPDCSILLVEISVNFCETDFTEGVATAAKLGASAASISIGGIESTDPNLATIDAGAPTGPDPCPGEDTWVYDNPGPYSTPGHLVFVASGDFGYDNINSALTNTVGGASPSYPSSSPYVVAVGGTALYAETGGGYGEGVWDDGHFGLDLGTTATSKYQDSTTSGCSTEFAMPPWQASVLTGTGCSMRATADISAAATFFSGTTETAIGMSYSGEYTAAEGTSAASPMMAAVFTRLGLTTEASNDLSWMYSNPSAFNDVGGAGYPLPTGASVRDAPLTSACTTAKNKLCYAGTGWDGPTGLGSPNGTALAALPVSTSGPVPYPDAGVPEENAGDSGTATGDDGGSGNDDSGSGIGDDDSGSAFGDDSGGGVTPVQGADGGTSVDAGGNGFGGGGGGGSSGGCTAAAVGTSPASAGFAFLAVTLGLVGFGARRRRNRGE